MVSELDVEQWKSPAATALPLSAFLIQLSPLGGASGRLHTKISGGEGMMASDLSLPPPQRIACAQCIIRRRGSSHVACEQ